MEEPTKSEAIRLLTVAVEAAEEVAQKKWGTKVQSVVAPLAIAAAMIYLINGLETVDVDDLKKITGMDEEPS